MTYLEIGDGVYARSDGYGISLKVNSPMKQVAIYLEPEVLFALIQYAIEMGLVVK